MAEQALMKTNKKLHLLSGITRHDIRNKITVLQGLLPIIQQLSEKPDDKEIIRIFSTAIYSINEQIEFTRVYQDLGVQSPVWQDLSRLIKKASDIGVPDNIKISDFIHGIKVYSDPLLERVFYNLIDNSLRHGGEGVSKMSFTWRNEEDLLIIIYEDNGIGIPLENKEMIFNRGYGTNTGLGLFLVREILSITGITIIENGEHGQGARFEIIVPYGFYTINDKHEN
jgi:signal transduction histidine kinase